MTGKSGNNLLEKTDADAPEHFVEVEKKEAEAEEAPSPAPEKKSLRRRMSISSKPSEPGSWQQFRTPVRPCCVLACA